MSDEIFRKKSLDKVKSPDNLDDYIRVSNPGIWLLLISVIILLAGACVWGVFGHIDSTIPSTVHISNGQSVCYITEENIASVKVGSTVKFADKEASIKTISQNKDKGYICTLSETPSIPDGIYEGKVVVESFKPISFIFN